MRSPQLSDLGDSTSYREEPIHIEFSAKETSAAARRFADVIRFKQACEGEMKMYGDDESCHYHLHMPQYQRSCSVCIPQLKDRKTHRGFEIYGGNDCNNKIQEP